MCYNLRADQIRGHGMATLTKSPIKVAKRHCYKGKPLPDIFYEDPEPVEDGMNQMRTISRVMPALDDWFPNDFVGWAGFIMPDPEDGNNRFAPDGYISFDVPRDFIWDMNLPNYWVWVVGKLPELALEVASPSTSDNDLRLKRGLYLRLGFREYWLLDPEGDLYGKPITGLHRVGNEFEEYEVHAEPNGDLWAHSELLGLEFWWLRDALPSDPFDVRDPQTGKSICLDAQRDYERAGRIVAEQLAQSERQDRIEAERREQSEREARREAERRAERLLKKLRRMRGEEDE